MPRPPTTERGPEAVPEQSRETDSEALKITPISESVPTATVPVPSVPPSAPSPKDPVLVAIEQILSEGLEDLYREMPSEAQQKFKAHGEVTASKIKQMIDSAKVKARSILKLIHDWLRIIPGVNRFFLEQESKIKTDKILAYTEKKKE